MMTEHIDTIKKIVLGILELKQGEQEELEAILKALWEVDSKATLRAWTVKLFEEDYQNKTAYFPIVEVEYLLHQGTWALLRDYFWFYLFEVLAERGIRVSDAVFEKELAEEQALY